MTAPWYKTNHWKVMATRLLRQGCPEDASHDRPIYLLDVTDVPPKHRGVGCFGYYHFALDVVFQEHIRKAGYRPDRRGFACVVHFRPEIGDTFAEAAAMARTAIHEFVHYLDWKRTHLASQEKSGWDEVTTLLMCDQLLRFAAPTKATTAAANQREGPWISHGERYHRAACHVAHRVFERTGFPLFAHQLGGERYGLSAGDKYAAALGGEIAERINEPIANILNTPAPEAFTKLFRRDTERWQRNQQKAKEAA